MQLVNQVLKYEHLSTIYDIIQLYHGGLQAPAPRPDARPPPYSVTPARVLGLAQLSETLLNSECFPWAAAEHAFGS